MFRTLGLVIALSAATPALAQGEEAVELHSDVFIERTSTDASGRAQTILEEPSVVVPGDKLVFVLRYHNGGQQPANAFVVTNPIPTAVAFEAAPDAAATVSVDGGRSWGRLSALTIRSSDGTPRAARPEDVTHVRWAFARPIPAGEAGRLMFRGIVR